MLLSSRAWQETGRDGEPAEAWMVFGLQDVVRLRQMVHEKPADEATFLAISGVGQAKLERYGAEFLEVIRSEHS